MRALLLLLTLPLWLAPTLTPWDLLAAEASPDRVLAQATRTPTAAPRGPTFQTPTPGGTQAPGSLASPSRTPTALPGALPATSPTTAPTAAPTVTPTASAAVPSAPTTAGRGNGQWVSNPEALPMWSSPDADAINLGTARPGSYFELTGSGTERRYFVYSPLLQEYAWIDVTAVRPATPPAATTPAAGPARIAAVNLPGRSLAYTVRSWPRVAPDTRVRDLAHNTPVFVSESVRGEDGGVWYRVGDDEYVHSDGIRLPKGPPLMYSGRWIDVDLVEPAMMTAYEDDRIVYTALALHGTVADQTPSGLYRIQRRVENETMDSATVGIPRDSPRGYHLENVLYTQYFTGDGAAIHYNYWSSHFGYAGTHGCLGVNYDDALWLWNWATVGTPVHIH